MPIKLNFKRTHRYNVSAKDLYVIRIFTLDGTCVEYTVSTTTTGRDALEYVAQRLDIEDTCFFGFKYEDWSGESRWLFLNKSVKKQLDKHARQHALTLTVMLFIDNPQFISDSQLRRFFYLQLRQDVASGLLPVTLKLGIKLSAYSLQADFGDFVDVQTTLANWRERSSMHEGSFCGAFDLSTTEYVDDILWGYLHLQGVSQDNAIWYFLDEIRHIPRYGVRTFRGMTCRNEPAELGVSRNGINITTLEPQQRTTANLKWEHIKDLTYSRKTFTIQLLKKNKAVHFLFEDNENARYLWQFCIQMHSSYIEYWTRVKSAPQQPAIHVSEPPDILRGTELRCLNPGSPMMNETLPEGTTPPMVSQLNNSSPSDPVAAHNLSDEMHTMVAVHGVDYPTEFAQTNEHRTFKIDPTRFVAGSVGGVDPNTTGTQGPNEPFLSSSAPAEPGHLERENLALLTAMQDNAVDGGTGAGESEAGTLIGQWSLRSAADTLDSQMVNQGCVTCLPGRECLRPAAGWFQPRTGITSHGANWNTTGQRHEKSTRKAVKSDPTDREIDPVDGKSTRSPIGLNRTHGHHHRHHHQHNTQDPVTVPQLAKGSEQRTHRTRQPKRQRQQQRETTSVATTLVSRTRVPMGGVNVIIDGAPSSPSSLASSDTSSGHRMASSRASFSSTSSSCCSARMKKPSNQLCGPVSGRGARSGPGDAADSCSSSSSSTSSINSAAAVDETNADRVIHHESDEGGKKTHFGFTAALCSVAHNIAFKPNSKMVPRQTGHVTNAAPVHVGSSTLNTGRKLWNDLIQSNHGGLRPLLTGFSQHHYRPQVQLKRQQAVVDATLQEQCLSLGQIGQDGEPALEHSRARKGRRNSGGTGVTTVSGNAGSSPLHDFQRWITAAKQRLPTVWTNTVASRGMTLQISAPIPSNPAGDEPQLETDKTGLGVPSNMEAVPTRYTSQVRPHELPVLDTSLPGRLARSSSEACARDLTGLRGLRFNKNPNAQFSAPQQQSPLYPDSMDPPSVEHLRGAIPGSRPGPPTIHLYPPSPTQTTYSHHSASLESDPMQSKQLWSYGSHSEDSGCPNTQVDIQERAQTGELGSACLERARMEGTSETLVDGDPNVRRASLENRPANDPRSQRNLPILQRQGAFRASPQWRLIPGPLNLTERGQPPSAALNVAEGTTLSNILFPNNPDPVIESSKHHQQQSPPAVVSHQPPVPPSDVPINHQGIGLQHVIEGKVNVNRLLEGLDSSNNGHFSAPPSTPSGRLHFIWSDLSVDSNPIPVSSAIPMLDSAGQPEWLAISSRTTGTTSGVNLSNYLSTEKQVIKQNNSLIDSAGFQEPSTVLDSGSLVQERHTQQWTSSEQHHQQQQPQQEQQQRTQEQDKTTGDGGDPSGHPFNTLLTTSSSSEQSSAQRPPSSGPIHLLTHSDIHQLLSLTNIRETALAHRLLAEYRQALLQQHSLHTNSVSTPNLTASQELQMFSSSTAAEDIEEVEVDPVVTERPKNKRTKHSKTHAQRNQHTDSRSKQSQPKPDADQHDAHPDPNDPEHDTSEAHGPRRRRRRRKELNSIDSPDYVNAAAFRGDRCGAGERPLSLASSTEMESNGTFRVLSSLDTRTSSVACGSFGNLTAPGASFGSGDGNGFDLIQGIHNPENTAQHAGTTNNGISGPRDSCATTELGIRQSGALSWDQLSHRRCPSTRGPARDLTGSHGQVGVMHDLPEGTGWEKQGEQPPDLCLSSTYPNLCEEQHGIRNNGHVLSRQPGTFSNLSPRQRDPLTRRTLVGEYENLESLSNDKLHRLRTMRQPVLPNRQTTAQFDTNQNVSVASSETNRDGPSSALGYSTATSMPASPSSESMSSTSSISSTISSSSASSGTSSSSELGCAEVISDPIREINDQTNEHCTPNGHSPRSSREPRQLLGDQESESCVKCDQIEPNQPHHHHHHHHNHHHRPTSPTQQHQPQQKQQQQQHSHQPEHMNLAMLLNRRDCLEQHCTSRKVLFVPDTVRSRRRLTHCPCKCHRQSTLTKSNSLRLNSTTQLNQSTLNTYFVDGNRANRNSESTVNTTNNTTTNNTTNSENINGIHGNKDSYKLSFGRQKARSFDPFSRDTCPLMMQSRQHTPVRFQPTQSHLATSRSTQNCRRPTGQLTKMWHGTSSLHSKRLKPCLKTLPWSSEQSAGASCLSYSDEDATDVLCYLSDDDKHRTDDATSATLSATESPCFSSASSYSFSTSSLDAQTEELCPHYHHWYAPSCTPISCIFHEPERTRRGGSLDPSTSIQRLPTPIRNKRTSQPSSHRSSHRKRSMELYNLQSNSCFCPCTQPPRCVCYSFGTHGHVHTPKLLTRLGMHQSLEEDRQKIRSTRRIHKTPPMNVNPLGIPVRTRTHNSHQNDTTGTASNSRSSNTLERQIQCTQMPSQTQQQSHPHGHPHHRNHHHNHHHHHHHPHHHHHTNPSHQATERSTPATGTKPPVAKRKSNEMREQTGNESTNETGGDVNETAMVGSGTAADDPTSTNQPRYASTEASVQLSRPRNLQLVTRSHDSPARIGCSFQSPPGFGSPTPPKESSSHEQTSPVGFSQHTDRPPTLTGSRKLMSEDKRQPVLTGSSIPRSPRVSPDILTRPLIRSTSNNTETNKSLLSPNGLSGGKYAPSMIPSRARQSETYSGQPHGSSQIRSNLVDHSQDKVHPASLPSTSGSLFLSELSDRPKTLQIKPSRGSHSSPTAAICTSSLLVNPLQSSSKAVGEFRPIKSSAIRQPGSGGPNTNSAMRTKTLGSPTDQASIGNHMIGTQSQLVRSGSLEPTTDLTKPGMIKPTRRNNTVTSTLTPPRNSTPDEIHTAPRSVSGLAGKLMDKQITSSRSVIDSSSASKPFVSSSFASYDKGTGSVSRPLLSTSRFSNSLAKRI